MCWDLCSKTPLSRMIQIEEQRVSADVYSLNFYIACLNFIVIMNKKIKMTQFLANVVRNACVPWCSLPPV